MNLEFPTNSKAMQPSGTSSKVEGSREIKQRDDGCGADRRGNTNFKNSNKTSH